MAQPKSITFLASIPPLLAAIKVSGDATGLRLQLDIPETEVANALALMLYRQCALKVTIEPLPNTPQLPRPTKQKSEQDELEEVLNSLDL